VLRITFNSCKTVYTYSMVLATVNIDKIIKVTSASSYVYLVGLRLINSSVKTSLLCQEIGKKTLVDEE